MNVWAKIIAAMVVIALAAGLVWGITTLYESHMDAARREAEQKGVNKTVLLWNDERRKQDAQHIKDLSDARTTERNAAVQSMAIEREAQEKKNAHVQADAAVAKRNADGAGRVFGLIANLDAAALALGMPGASACPGEFAKQRQAAIDARAVARSCVAEYRSLGEDAVATLRPLNLKLDTALKYIAVVSP